MTPYAVTISDIPQTLLDVFKGLRKFVEELPDIPGEILTCHAVCTAIAFIHPHLECVDGTFGDFFNHSWLVDKNFPHVIMDMYPVAGGVPFIVCGSNSFLAWGKLYKQKVIIFSQEDRKRQTEKILAF